MDTAIQIAIALAPMLALLMLAAASRRAAAAARPVRASARRR